jgi:signal transduction histidine kinase/DNA-binding response OmpR family regulator/signal transduction protein with GAF and PtsI domain
MKSTDAPTRILLIEDNPDDARLLRKMLIEARRFPFDLQHADRLSAGLERLADDDVDVVLLDLSLPDSAGLDTFTRTLAQAPHTPIVVLSGLDDAGIAFDAVRAGAQDYLTKAEVDGNLLARAIHYAIERKRAETRQAYYLQTEQTLRQISSRFVDPKDLDQAIKDTLRETGTVLQANRAHLFRVHDDGAKMSNTHEWVAEGTLARIEELQTLDTAAFPWAMNRFYENEIVALSDVSQLPEPERGIVERLGVVSVLAIPIFTHGALYGFCGVVETEQSREWGTAEVGFLRSVSEILGRAIERARAEQYLQQRNLELATLNAVAQGLSASLELQDLLDEALSRTVHALRFTGGLIHLADEHTGELDLASYTGLSVPLLEQMETQHPALGVCQRVFETKTTLSLDDLCKDAPGEAEELLNTGLRSYVGTPIVYKEQRLGTLCLFDTALHAITENERALLTTIGQQIGVAVENARLFGDVAREREIAQTLRDTAEALGKTLQIDKLLEGALDTLQRVVPYDAASISLLHEEKCWIVVSRGMEQLQSKTFTLQEHPLVQRVVRERTPIIIPDVSQEPDWLPVQGAAASWLGIPLIAKNKPIGVLMIDSRQSDAYDEGTARLALSFAHQVGLAIDNSRLYEQTRAQLREAVLLRGVTATLSSTLEMEQMLPYIARSLCEALNTTSAEIYGFDEENNIIAVNTHYATPQSTAKEQTSHVGETHALAHLPQATDALGWSRVAQMQRDNEDITQEERELLKAHDAQAALLLPITARGHMLGLAIVWESEGPRRFTEGEIALGQTLSHQAAIALENARLFEETRKQVKRTELLLEASEAAASTLDSTEVMRRLARAVAHAIGADLTGAYVVDATGTALQPIAGYHVPEERLETYKEFHIPLKGQAFVEQAWQNQQTMFSDDVPNDVRFDAKTRQLFPAQSVLLLPMIVRRETIGGLWAVWWEEVHHFAGEELQLVEGIVREAAVAIQNAHLFEEVEANGIELQQRAHALEEANVRLQELDRLKSQFLAHMSHELRTPLNSIIGFSEVLCDGLVGRLTPEQLECADNILGSGEHLLTLINDILDLSKIEAGRIKLDTQAFEVPRWLQEVQRTIGPLVEKKSQTLKIELAEDLPPLIADPTRIKQVLINLLGNAIKFTPEGGSITLSCRLADPETMIFSVTDTGIGIKLEDQEIIFEEFRQSSSASVGETKGTGLGLAISKRLVEMHGGHIWVDSEYGVGSTFSFLLPVSSSEAKLGAARDTTTPSDSRTVLVIEDDRQFNNLLSFYLRQQGHRPAQHYAGTNVLERVLDLHPDVITLDIKLPDRNGWEVLRILKSNPRTKDIPVLVISVVENGERALQLGATDYLVKPVRRQDIQGLLDRLTTTESVEETVRVLIVDDDRDVIELLKEMLPGERYEMLAAQDGEEGFRLAGSECPDVILLDLMMPGTSGFDMLERLRAQEETAHIPVIVLTAIDMTPEQRQFLQETTVKIMRKTALTPQSLLAELRLLDHTA